MIGGLWVKIPCKMLTDERLMRSDIVVFGYLADKLKQRTAAITATEIAKACELHKNTVAKALLRLEEAGYIKADRTKGKPTKYTQLILPAAQSKAKPTNSKSAPADGFDAEKYKILINNFGSKKGAESV